MACPVGHQLRRVDADHPSIAELERRNPPGVAAG
jgi:hypothetical protein